MNRIITEKGQIVNGKVVVDTAAIYTRLIQEAGRWCEEYASDILHLLNDVQKAFDTPIANWAGNVHCECMSGHPDWVALRWSFGFRGNGIDNGTYIEKHQNEGVSQDYYRAIWRVGILAEPKKGEAEFTLSRIDN